MEGPRYPNFAGKHELEAIFSPAEVVASLKGHGDLLDPDAVILTYQRSLLDELEARGVQPAGGYPGPWRSLWFTGSRARKIAVAGGFGIGAPAAVTVLEELIALGAREFISIGEAGCLQPRCAFGEAIVCTGAIRDEGVSHHYAPTERFAWPSEGLTTRLTEALTAGGTAPKTGLTWTIDAPYRETAAEARSYQAEGVLCVEMEAAACSQLAGIAASTWLPPSSSVITSLPGIAGRTRSAPKRSGTDPSACSTPPFKRSAGTDCLHNSNRGGSDPRQSGR
jgi:uridine phosphorylase